MSWDTDSWRRWHYYRARNQLKRNKSSSLRKKDFISLYRDGNYVRASGRAETFAPENFQLSSNPENVIQFLEQVRRTLLITTPRRLRIYDPKRKSDPFRPAGKPRRIGRYISFDRIKYLDPAAAILLAAEFDRGRRRFQARLPAINVERWDPNVREMLRGLGFFNLLEIGDPPKPIGLRDQTGVWRVYPFSSGQKIETDKIGQPLKDLAVSLGVSEDDFYKHPQLPHLYRSLIDGMSNVFEHAYVEVPYLFPHVKSWWFSGAVDFENKRLMLILYDQGVTIPGSLEKGAEMVNRSARSALRRLIRNKASDGELIEHAVETQLTTTGDEQRGRGLGKLRDFVDACSTGEMQVFSRKGSFMYEKGKVPSMRDHACSVGGTLLILQVSL